MYITLDNISCLLHLPIRGRLLDHSMINRADALDMKVAYLGAEPKDALKVIEVSKGYHARFGFIESLYAHP